MSHFQGKCFVIMPFVPELHYFYLYLKLHIKQHHNIQCERADEQTLTVPVLDKINDFIRAADVIIADCTGRNPNVFYELGIAHAHDKKVILISQGRHEDVPSDIKHYEFIFYQLDRHEEFLSRLDNALRNALSERYEALYQRAVEIFSHFRAAARIHTNEASKELFLERVQAAEHTQELPSPDDALAVAEFVLPKIVADTSDINVLRQIDAWLSEQYEV